MRWGRGVWVLGEVFWRFVGGATALCSAIFLNNFKNIALHKVAGDLIACQCEQSSHPSPPPTYSPFLSPKCSLIFVAENGLYDDAGTNTT